MVGNNTEYGGHLTAHIAGQNPPDGFSQNNQTLFDSSQDYYDAYQELSNDDPPLYCANGAPLHSEAARTIAIQFYSRQCTNAHNNTGRCTQYDEVQTHYVRFVFRVVPDDNRRRWILYTAYPRVNP